MKKIPAIMDPVQLFEIGKEMSDALRVPTVLQREQQDCGIDRRTMHERIRDDRADHKRRKP